MKKARFHKLSKNSIKKTKTKKPLTRNWKDLISSIIQRWLQSLENDFLWKQLSLTSNLIAVHYMRDHVAATVLKTQLHFIRSFVIANTRHFISSWSLCFMQNLHLIFSELNLSFKSITDIHSSLSHSLTLTLELNLGETDGYPGNVICGCPSTSKPTRCHF